MAQFRTVYKPLDDVSTSIRLVEVLPPSLSSFVHIRMRQERAPTEYRCLSYMWGDVSKQCEILINDTPVCVGCNLYYFLRTAQRRYAEQPLWIDALCINQDDNAEKSHQVQRMGDIYSRAEAVLVWLGVEPALKDLFSFAHMVSEARKEEAYDLSAILGRQKENHLINLFHRLCESPYWGRTWIIQELLLACKLIIVHGAGEMCWDSLDVAINASLSNPTYAIERWRFLSASTLLRFVQHRRSKFTAVPYS